jgi:hypothetical protein
VFPNPAKERITLSHLPIGSMVNIYNLTGKNVCSLVIKNDPTTINTADFENGVYFVQGMYNGAVSARKLIIY